jgi:hypothetical protein
MGSVGEFAGARRVEISVILLGNVSPRPRTWLTHVGCSWERTKPFILFDRDFQAFCDLPGAFLELRGARRDVRRGLAGEP